MLEIITIICTAATVIVFGLYAVRLTTFDNIMQPAINDFEKRNKTFYNSFWTFYPKIKRRHKKNLDKFMLYFLAQRGYINIDVDSNNIVRVVKNTISFDKASIAERYLLEALFGNADLIEYADENAIISNESVELSRISDYYKQMVKTCPFKESVKAPVASSDGERAIDYASIKKESQIYKYCIILMLFFALLPSAIYEGSTSAMLPIIFAYYCVISILVLLLSLSLSNLSELLGLKANVEPPKKDAPSPSKTITLKSLQTTCKSNNHVILAYIIAVLRFLLWSATGIFASIFIPGFISVTGTYEQRLLGFLGLVLVIIAWIIKCTRRAEKEKYFAMRKKIRKSYMKFFKKAFTPKMLGMYSANPKKLSYLIPYSVLMGKSDVLKDALPVSPDSMPDWLTQTQDLTFDEIDNLVDNSLHNVS